MDSARKALLQNAQEFGFLAHNLSLDEVLAKSVTHRTLALYLGVEALWWSEFWRSFSFAKLQNENLAVRRFQLCGKADDLRFILMFLSCWFGGDVPIASIPKKEFDRVARLFAREGKNERKNSQSDE